MEEVSSYTVECEHGLAQLESWRGEKVLNRTEFMVPTVIVAYNRFMNGVDRLNQVSSSYAICRREKRMCTSIFPFLLDAAIQNAYCLLDLNKTDQSKHTEFRELKRVIAKHFVLPERIQVVERKPLKLLGKENCTLSFIEQ